MSRQVSVTPLPVGDDATRRRLSPRQAATVARLGDALLAELATVDYDGLTVRSVARRAGVAPATAYTYFTSKAHLVAEVFWRRLRAPAADRVGAVLRDVAALVAAEPALGAACSPALLGPDPDVRHLRDRIGAELHRRVAGALAAPPPRADAAGARPPADAPPHPPARPRPDLDAHADPDPDLDLDAHADPDLELLAEAIDLMLAGALLRAGTGHLRYDAIGDRLATLTRLVIGDRP